MKYRCLSTSAENWEICEKNSVWGMDARYFVTFEKYLKGGDKAIVYTHGGKFVAIIEFVGEQYFSDEDIKIWGQPLTRDKSEEVSRYIHLNPVRVKVRSGMTLEEKENYLRKYHWSSYGGYLSPRGRRFVRENLGSALDT